MCFYKDLRLKVSVCVCVCVVVEEDAGDDCEDAGTDAEAG